MPAISVANVTPRGVVDYCRTRGVSSAYVWRRAWKPDHGCHRSIMNKSLVGSLAALAVVLLLSGGLKALPPQASAQQSSHTISAEDCMSSRLGTSMPISSIG